VDTAEQLAPPVVAVMVVHEPDLWFDEVLTSLEQQDYPNLRVLVLVTGEPGDVPEQVRSRVPRALVRSVAGNPGFAAAANEAF
jgi:GT2 family glycosyltransferase